jgi:hypothetical protein
MDCLALDIDLIRKTPDILRESQKKRFKPVEFVEEAIKFDKDWREGFFFDFFLFSSFALKINREVQT